METGMDVEHVLERDLIVVDGRRMVGGVRMVWLGGHSCFFTCNDRTSP